MVQMEAFSPNICWYSSWNSVTCCNFLLLASVQLVVSICISSSVFLIFKSVPELLWLSSKGGGFETKAIAIGQKMIWNINISIKISRSWFIFWCGIDHYILWELGQFPVQHCFIYFQLLLWTLTKKIISGSSLCSFLMSFILSSIFRCNSPPEMILYSQS